MDPDAQQHREYLRQEVVRRAVNQADQIIMDAANGDEEKLNRYTAQLAIALFEQTTTPLTLDKPVLWGKYDAPVQEAITVAFEEVAKIPEKAEPVLLALCSAVATKFVEKTNGIYASRLLRWDMENPAEKGC